MRRAGARNNASLLHNLDPFIDAKLNETAMPRSRRVFWWRLCLAYEQGLVVTPHEQEGQYLYTQRI